MEDFYYDEDYFIPPKNKKRSSPYHDKDKKPFKVDPFWIMVVLIAGMIILAYLKTH